MKAGGGGVGDIPGREAGGHRGSEVGKDTQHFGEGRYLAVTGEVDGDATSKFRCQPQRGWRPRSRDAVLEAVGAIDGT